MNWINTLDRGEIAYYIGLLMLFIGISFSVSVASAFVVVGTVIVAESVITSYLAAWINK